MCDSRLLHECFLRSEHAPRVPAWGMLRERHIPRVPVWGMLCEEHVPRVPAWGMLLRRLPLLIRRANFLLS